MAARSPSGPPGPAGFWQRSVAWSVDAALIAPLAWLLAWQSIEASAQAWLGRADALLHHAGEIMGKAIADGVPLPLLANSLQHDPAMGDAIAAIQSASWSLAWPFLLGFALLGAAYHIACECSPRQASIGKRLLGIRACDLDGRRLGAGRALARHLAGALSWATLNIGHLMASATPHHLALHDRCSGTRVVSDGSARPDLPGWAWAWLGALTLAAVGVGAWLATMAAAIMRGALEQALS